jgi:hypothetical protein
MSFIIIVVALMDFITVFSNIYMKYFNHVNPPPLFSPSLLKPYLFGTLGFQIEMTLILFINDFFFFTNYAVLQIRVYQPLATVTDTGK